MAGNPGPDQIRILKVSSARALRTTAYLPHRNVAMRVPKAIPSLQARHDDGRQALEHAAHAEHLTRPR